MCLRILLIGKTGVGKSSLGNVLLKGNKFASLSSGTSVTLTAQKESTPYDLWLLDPEQHESNESILVSCFDTPGFDCTEFDNTEIRNRILESIKQTNPGIHAILYVTEIGRLSADEANSIDKFLEIFGEKAYPYVLVVFTHKDKLRGNSLEQHLKTMPNKIKDFCAKCQLRSVAIDSRRIGVEVNEQALYILRKVYSSSKIMHQPYYSTVDFRINIPNHSFQDFSFNSLKNCLATNIRKFLPDKRSKCIFVVAGFVVFIFFFKKCIFNMALNSFNK